MVDDPLRDLNIEAKPALDGQCLVTARLNGHRFESRFDPERDLPRFCEDLVNHFHIEPPYHSTKGPDYSAIDASIEAKVHAAVQAAEHPDGTDQFEPFPAELLPEPLATFVATTAEAIDTDASMVALPALSVLASAIGNARRLQLKAGWSVPSVLWTSVVGYSGSAKTPAFDAALAPLHAIQRQLLTEHADHVDDYEQALVEYERDLKTWRNSKQSAEPPTKPEPPAVRRLLVGDTTVEALATVLEENPRGVLVARDELSGWLGSFDRYAAGRGSADASHWLSMFNGQPLLVDRKTGAKRLIVVDRAAVSITGGIQPGVLHKSLSADLRDAGLAARFLLAMPPRRLRTWSDATTDPSAASDYASVVRLLHDITSPDDSSGEVVSSVDQLGIDFDALGLFVEHHDEVAAELLDASPDMAAALSKLQETPARLALVFHLVRWMAGDATVASSTVVDADSMAPAVELAKWFRREARRVYRTLERTSGDRSQLDLLAWIRSRGGSVTPRDVQRGRQGVTTAGQAELMLCELVKAGHGRWSPLRPNAKGGRPTRVFVMTQLTHDKTS